MAETLGMLCDKLTIVKLKQYHTDSAEKLASLELQATQLRSEIDEYIQNAIEAKIPVEKMSFVSNKVYKEEGNKVSEVNGNFGEIVYQLADVNCQLWHEQEKVYDFKNVPPEKKDSVVSRLAILNLQRNKCIDAINKLLIEMISKK